MLVIIGIAAGIAELSAQRSSRPFHDYPYLQGQFGFLPADRLYGSYSVSAGIKITTKHYLGADLAMGFGYSNGVQAGVRGRLGAALSVPLPQMVLPGWRRVAADRKLRHGCSF